MKSSAGTEARSPGTRQLPELKRVVVVRPYGRSIRERVFRLLATASLDMRNAHILHKHTPDDEVVAFLSRSRRQYEVLLVPFHAHRDRNGAMVNGLSVLNLLARHDHSLVDCPIFMPISAMGMSSAKMMLSRDASGSGLNQAVRRRVLFMPEDELSTPELQRSIVAHAFGNEFGERKPDGP